MDIIIVLLLVVGLTLVAVSWVKADLKCPPPKIEYKYITPNTLDTQFSEDNKPSKIYADMFVKGTPWIGGYTLGDGKTMVATEKSN